MPKLVHTIEIRAPIERVFAFVADWRKTPLYVPDLVEIKPTGAVQYGLGTRLRGEVRAMGISLVSESEVVEFTPPHRIVTRSVSGLANDGTWLFEPTAEGTRVTSMVTYRPPGSFLGRFASSLVGRQVEEGVRHSLKNLKRLLEDEG